MYRIAVSLCALLTIGLLFIFFSSKTHDTVTFSEVSNNTISEKEVASGQGDLDILVFGDVMLDRAVRSYIDTQGTAELFKYVHKEIHASDITVINLEGPITEYASVVTPTNFQFTFATHTARDLATAGIDIVSLANNHTHNFGKNGLLQTRRYLQDAGILFFGDPYNASSTLTITPPDTKPISFIGLHQFESYDLTMLATEISELKNKGHFVLFYPHWGDEYKRVANVHQRKIAETAIRAGADMVIGAHPHVIQDATFIDSKPVFFSLGNFIFDQWFSSDVQHGLALRLTIRDSELQGIELKPFFRERFQPVFFEGEVRISWCREYVATSALQSDAQDPCIITLQ